MLKSTISGARAQFPVVTTEPNTAEKIVMAYEHGLIVFNVFHRSLGHPSRRATLKMYVKSAFPTPSNFNNHLLFLLVINNEYL